MKLYGAKIAVIDHHFPGEIKKGKVEVDDYIDAHINPYLKGYDSNVCAGMLGFELARFIYLENENMNFIPAMAAILDHCLWHTVESSQQRPSLLLLRVCLSCNTPTL